MRKPLAFPLLVMFVAAELFLGGAACSNFPAGSIQSEDAAAESEHALDHPTNGSLGGAQVNTGGSPRAGGTLVVVGSGGAGGMITTGGRTTSGGSAGMGGVANTGGHTTTGGSADTGGTSGTGGSLRTGGSVITGGSARTGGNISTSGNMDAGADGRPNLLGNAGSGGRVGSGDAMMLDGSVGSGGKTILDGSLTTGTWWKPSAGLTWQWQIGGGTIDPTLAVDVFDIDWEQDAGIVSQLHQAHKKVICYISVGSWESWRSDASTFPAAVLGKDYPGWPGEKFVDIRAQALRNLMAKRLDVCKAKGFDAVEPDNMDVFSSNSGFPLTQTDGVGYAKWLAAECHARGMGIVQKNAPDITASIQSLYDGALTEDCKKDNWCADMQAYVDANKPVFACEYTSSIFTAACAWGKPKKYSFILKSLDLNAPVTFCK